MVGVQGEDAVDGAFDHGVHHIGLAGRGKHHVQEVASVAQLVLGVHKGLADAVFVGHRHQRWHFGDQTDGSNFAVLGVVDVGAVVVEGRQCADQAGHDGHRVRVTAETAQEKLHLLVDHGVVLDVFGKGRFGGLAGQVAVEQQVAGLHVIALGRQLLNRVAAVQQFALVAVNEGDGRLAGGCRQKSWVVGEHAGLAVELADVDDFGADIAAVHGQVDCGLAVAEGQRGFVIRQFHFSPFNWFSQHIQHPAHILAYQRFIHLGQCLAAQIQIQQIVITQLHQQAQGRGIGIRQRACKALEESLDKQVIFQEPTPAAPLQLAQRAGVNQRFRQSALLQLTQRA